MFQTDYQKKLLLFSILFLFLLLTALWITSTAPLASLKIISGIIILLIAFLSTETALYFLIFSMLLSPEIVVAETAAREVTLRLEDLLLPIIAMGWLARIALYKELGLILKTSLNRPILCYILVSLISTGFGVISGRVGLTPGFLFVVKYIEFFIVYFMVVNHVSTEKQVRNFTIAILVTAGIIAIYAIMQIPFEARVSAPFEGGQGEPNTLGGYLVLIISLAIGLMITLKDRRLKVLLSGLLLLLMIPFLHTLSRSSWMAFGGMYLFYLIKGQRKVFFILILLLLISLLPIILPQEVKERYSETVSKKPIISSEQVKVGKYYLDLSASERVRSWRKILKDWKNKPVFGYGITGYGFVDGQYFRTLIESGLIGFMTLIYLIYSMITTFYKGFTLKTPFHKGLSIGLLAGVVALSAHAVGSNTFVIVRIMEPLWFLAGLAVVLPRIEETV